MRVKVNNKTYINFSSVTISRSLDAVASSFTLEAYYDVENKEQINALLPLGYQDITIVDDNDNLLLTGVCLNTSKTDEATANTVSISGYSKAGVLQDSNVPINVNSLQSNGVSLKDITEKLIEPFGLKLVIDKNSVKKANEKVSRTYTYMNEDLDGYLIDLALRKNIVLSHNEYGDLLFLSVDKDVPAKYFFDRENTVTMSLSVEGQEMHSEISATRQVSRRSRKNPSPQIRFNTIKNPLITKHRPKNYRTNINSDIDLETHSKSFFMEELENIGISISINDYIPELKAGDFIEVLNPHIFIFKTARLLIKTVAITVTPESKTTTLECVIPGAFTGEVPTNIFEL